MKTFVYFGTRAVERSEGIYCYSLDLESGAMEHVATTPAVNSSFISIAPSKKVLYSSVNREGAAKGQDGGLSAYSLNPCTGEIELINTVASPTVAPSHVQVDRIGSTVFGANYHNGFVATFPVRADGGLAEMSDLRQHSGTGPNTDRQEASHPHSVFTSPDNRFALVCDLGTDKIHTYALDIQKGILVDSGFATAAPGAGPRHLAFHPSGRFVYVLNEMASTVGVYQYESATGVLTEIQILDTLPNDYDGIRWAAEILVSPDGRFVYSSNRGHESISIFSVDPTTGQLTLIGHEPTRGIQPRNFGIEPTGRWLIAANMDSDTCELFRIDRQTGTLAHTQSIEIPACSRVAFL